MPVAAGRERSLLAGLLLRAGRLVTVEELIYWLWDDDLPGNPRGALHMAVNRLRKHLGEARSVIRSSAGGDGYLAEPGWLDLTEFRRLVTDADRAAGRGDTEAEAESLRRGLALWRGPVLSNVGSEPVHRELVPALVEERQTVLLRRIEADLALSRAAELVSELRGLTAEYPLQERIWTQLIRALQLSGRRAEALDTYEQVRRQLADELGVDPGDELRRLHLALVAAAPGPVGPEPSRAVPRQLPPDVRGFTGRAGDLAWLDGQLAEHDTGGAVVIAAIAGTAGAGKSALAVHWGRTVAHRFPDGQLWVNLRGYDPGRPVPPTQALTLFLRALGVPGADIPLDEDGQTALYRSLLEGRRMLIVLDNASSAEQVRPLLPGAAGCFVLVTSRDDLPGLVARDGAARIRLGLLEPDDSVALLRRLLGPHRATDPEALARLARLCAHLPLALRIAADRAGGTSAVLREVVAELAADPTLDAFAAGGDPHTAARTVFSWSYQAIPAPEAALFRRLGLIPGADWDLYAAASLAGSPPAHTRRMLDVLTNAHLIEERGGRYQMHDLLRAYAVERARAEDGEQERRAALGRLLDQYLYTSATAMDAAYAYEKDWRPRVVRPQTPARVLTTPGEALSWLEVERANLRAAVVHAAGHGWPAHAVDLSDTLYRHLYAASHNADAITVHRLALQAARSVGNRPGEAAALKHIGGTYWLMDRYSDALEQYQLAHGIYREVGDRRGEAKALHNMGLLFGQWGHYDQASEHFRQALASYRELGDRAGEPDSLKELGRICWLTGNYAPALAQYRQALGLYVATGDHPGEASTHDDLAEIHERIGRYADALEHAGRAVAIAREIGHRSGVGYSLNTRGHVLRRLRRNPEALEHHRDALAIFSEVGDQPGAAMALDGIGRVQLQVGNHADALDSHQRALEIARETGDQPSIEVRLRNSVGEDCRAMSRAEEALTQHQAALDLSRAMGDRYEQARALVGLGYARRGEGAAPRELWQQAVDIYRELGVPEAEEIRAALAGLITVTR